MGRGTAGRQQAAPNAPHRQSPPALTALCIPRALPPAVPRSVTAAHRAPFHHCFRVVLLQCPQPQQLSSWSTACSGDASHPSASLCSCSLPNANTFPLQTQSSAPSGQTTQPSHSQRCGEERFCFSPVFQGRYSPGTPLP